MEKFYASKLSRECFDLLSDLKVVYDVDFMRIRIMTRYLYAKYMFGWTFDGNL